MAESWVKPGDRKFVFYKLVLINKASILFHSQVQRVLYDYPPLIMDGFYCFDCQQVAMPAAIANKQEEDAVITDAECEQVMLPPDQPKEGFVLIEHKFKQLSYEFRNNFWKQPVSNYVNEEKEDRLEYEDMPEYKDMLQLWPSHSEHPSKKYWNFHCIKNKVELQCKNDFYLALATRYGKKWINHFLDELRNQKEFVFGSNKKYSCKKFQLWVNRVFKHKVDCRFYRLHNDERYFGLEEIGILGKLYLDDFTWELVDLVIPEANVKIIDDESKFYLQNFNESMRLQLLNRKME